MRSAPPAASLPPLATSARARARANWQAAPASLEPWAFRALVAAVLASLEAERLPPGLLCGLELEVVLVGGHAEHLERCIDDVVFARAWRRACRQGPAIVQRMAAVPKERHARLLWQSCALIDIGLISDQDLAHADPWAMIHAHTILAFLGERGAVDPLERNLLRAFVLGRR